ncbi:MAG TPA: nucleotidyltransferase family protein [Thermohalobaculum sp.]|nr:nucleotidyltransferase family protein [Thermohalobaculum sp.]
MSWTAVVLAGSRGPSDPVAEAACVSHKAFADVAGRPMIARVLDTLAASPSIGRVVVVIEPDAPPLPEGVERLDAAPSPARSALAGFERLDVPVLVTTADHPMLTPAMVEHFLAQAAATGADVAAGVAERSVVEQAGSTARRTYLKFRDAQISGCNLFALMTPRARAALTFWQRLEADRKRPLRMARAIGIGTLVRYLLGVLTTDGVANALGRAAGCRAAMVRMPFPEAAHDVDKASDLEFARRFLAARGDG